jgi:hypothetical protein
MNELINVLLIDDNPENYALTINNAYREGGITKLYNVEPENSKIPVLFFDGERKGYEKFFSLKFLQAPIEIKEFISFSLEIEDKYTSRTLGNIGTVPEIVIFDYHLRQSMDKYPLSTVPANKELLRLLNPNYALVDFLNSQDDNHENHHLTREINPSYSDSNEFVKNGYDNFNSYNDNFGLFAGVEIMRMFRTHPCIGIPATFKGKDDLHPDAYFFEWINDYDLGTMFNRAKRKLKDRTEIIAKSVEQMQKRIKFLILSNKITLDLNEVLRFQEGLIGGDFINKLDRDIIASGLITTDLIRKLICCLENTEDIKQYNAEIEEFHVKQLRVEKRDNKKGTLNEAKEPEKTPAVILLEQFLINLNDTSKIPTTKINAVVDFLENYRTFKVVSAFGEKRYPIDGLFFNEAENNRSEAVKIFFEDILQSVCEMVHKSFTSKDLKFALKIQKELWGAYNSSLFIKRYLLSELWAKKHSEKYKNDISNREENLIKDLVHLFDVDIQNKGGAKCPVGQSIEIRKYFNSKKTPECNSARLAVFMIMLKLLKRHSEIIKASDTELFNEKVKNDSLKPIIKQQPDWDDLIYAIYPVPRNPIVLPIHQRIMDNKIGNEKNNFKKKDAFSNFSNPLRDDFDINIKNGTNIWNFKGQLKAGEKYLFSWFATTIQFDFEIDGTPEWMR